MFHKVESKVVFSQMEENVLRFWQQNNIFEKSVAIREGSPHYTFYEGPPTANGQPGIHHVLSRTFKDVICRYRAMQGYHVPRKAGWDTHGLPVELEVEKSLGFDNKSQIEEYGIAGFNQLCRESVLGYIKEWKAMTERVGCWLDMEHPYMTMDDEYIESCWWILKQLWDRRLVYQGYRVTPHCPRCGTSLSSHEVALGYKEDTDDPSVYIKFRLCSSSRGGEKAPLREIIGDVPRGDMPVYFLVWTTTPWTLPGNTALAVAPDVEYSVMKGGEEYLILAAKLVHRVGLAGYEQVGTVCGEELVNLYYEPLFDPHDFAVECRSLPSLAVETERESMTYPVVGADFVSTEEGTGIVHIAPAFGEIDLGVGMANNLDFVQHVDLAGEIKGTFSFAGRFVKEADPLIIEELQERGQLYKSERILHTYPFCWRCETPLLYYAKKSWFIKTTEVKSLLISGNEEVNWYPQYIKHGRFGDWLENNVDWAFSRERYWGTPVNVWCCRMCGHLECIGSVKELRLKPGVSRLETPLNLHRPYVDEIVFACSQCGGEMGRVPEVVDCWFDSGAMFLAQWHYPFENSDKFKGNFPADFICEAVDQTRGWFYSLHAISVLLFGKPSFKNVISLGHLVDDKGEKMSKTRGNVVDPWKMVGDYGADAIRWYLLASSPAGNVHRFSTQKVAEAMRKTLLTLWNVYSFFVLYANIDHFVPRHINGEGESFSLPEIDRWIVSELNYLIAEVSDAMDEYDPTAAVRRIEKFVDCLSNWYVRRNRRRFWKSGNDDDKQAAYTTLHYCLVSLSRLMAPFVPFISEEIYRNLVCAVDTGASESVHLTDFPVADHTKIDLPLMRATRLVMTVCSLGRAARAKAGIKVRQPLARIVVGVDLGEEEEALQQMALHVKEELNVKELELVRGRIPGEMPGYVTLDEGERSVAIFTELSPELLSEGISREIVRYVQNMRRMAGFEIADHIITYFQTDAVVIKQVMHDFADYIGQETLSDGGIVEDSPPRDAHDEKYRISGSEILLAVKKVA